MRHERRRIVVILGPTAGGKSELAVDLAERFGGEVIGADSMQVYRRLDAGTAKPEPELRRRAVHHLIDIVEPTEPFSAADWIERAERTIAELHERGKLPIVVGGTNLYLKALLEGMFEGPPADPEFRRSLEPYSAQQLHEQLQQADPEAAERIHPNDRKRIVRALEVHRATGRPISEQQGQWSDQVSQGDAAERATDPRYRHDPILLGLRWAPEAINPRINQRVKRMFHPTDGSEDLIRETRRLHEAGLLGEQARQAIGTKQVLDHLAGQITAERAFEKVKIETRRFAKHQRSWLKRFRGVHWLAADETPYSQLHRQAERIVAAELSSGNAGQVSDMK